MTREATVWVNNPRLQETHVHTVARYTQSFPFTACTLTVQGEASVYVSGDRDEAGL